MPEVEAEVEPTELASRTARLLAALVDGAIVTMAWLMGALIGYIILPDNRLASLLVRGTLIVSSLVPQWVLVVDRGQSLGKLAMGIRIVKTDGSAVGFLHGVVLRSWITGWIWTCVYGSPLVDAVSIFRRDRRCLHDLLAGTKVVRA
jgi:uncharacterized RDD family membrane protein YckC